MRWSSRLPGSFDSDRLSHALALSLEGESESRIDGSIVGQYRRGGFQVGTTVHGHVKFKQIVHDDLTDYSGISEHLAGFDTCLFCLGASSVGMSEGRYRHITYDFTLATARALLASNQGLVFCYVSAAGADPSEHGRSMWVRVRGKTENDLLKLPLTGAYMFRPAYVHAVKGVTPQLPWLRVAYFFLRPLYPVLRALIPRQVTTGENFGRAMIRVAQHGYSSSTLESDDINAVAESRGSARH